MTKTPVNLINAQAVAASGSFTSTVQTLDDGVSQAVIYITNAGSSTNLSVLVSSSPDSAGTKKSPIQPVLLTATAGSNIGSVFLDVVPKYLWFTATNSDASNATTFSVDILEISYSDVWLSAIQALTDLATVNNDKQIFYKNGLAQEYRIVIFDSTPNLNPITGDYDGQLLTSKFADAIAQWKMPSVSWSTIASAIPTWDANTESWVGSIPSANITQSNCSGIVSVSSPTNLFTRSNLLVTITGMSGSGLGQIIPYGSYSHSSSNKQITLLGTFSSTSKEQILKITNLATGDLVYTSENSVKRNRTISVSGGVITYTCDASGYTDNDPIQIIIS